MNHAPFRFPAAPADGHSLLRRSHRLPVALVAVAIGIGACEQVVVEPARVRMVVVTPDRAETQVGRSVQLSAEAYDGEEHPLSGHAVAWSVEDDAIASIDGDGRVTGLEPGSTTARAMVGGVEGLAEITVREAASLAVDRSSVGFVADAGSGSPPAVNIAITNAGEGELTGLETSITYEDGSGWLSASLSRTRAPATLTLSASPGSRGPGTYDATVRLSADMADNSPLSIHVSLEIRQVPIPAAPTGVSASYRQEGFARIEWTPSSRATEYRVERRPEGESSFDQVGAADGDSDRFDDGSVAEDRRYTYRVRACNGSGCSDPSGQVTVVTPPRAPDNLRIIYAREERVRIAWRDRSSLETSFRIERARRNQSFNFLTSVGRNEETYTDRSVEEDTRYTYRVFACNESGCSGPSNTATAETDD